MKKISKPTLADLGLIGLTALMWASAFTAMKFAVDQTGAYWLATFRVGIGFLVLLPFFLWTASTSMDSLPKELRAWFLIATVSLFNMVIPFILISWGVKSVDAGVASLLMGTSPFLALVIGHFATTDDRITPRKAIAVVFGLAGILVIVGPSAVAGLAQSDVISQIAIICGSICYVIAGTVMRKISMPTIPFTTVALGLGTLMLVPVSLLLDGRPNLQLSGEAWIALLWLGAFPTGVAYILRYYLVQKVGMSTFALGVNLVPVFGVAIGAAILGEQITVQVILALILIVTGLFVVRGGGSSPKPSASPKVKAAE